MLNGEDEEDRLPLTKNEWEDDGRREEGDEVIKEGRQHQTNGSLSVLISIADSVFSLFVVFPLVCLYWRGTFGLQVSSTVCYLCHVFATANQNEKNSSN